MTLEGSRGGSIDAMTTAGTVVPAVDEVGGAVGEVGGSVRKVDGAAGDVGVAAGDVGDGVEDVGDGVEDVGDGVEDVGDGVEDVGDGVEDVGDVGDDVEDDIGEVGNGAKYASGREPAIGRTGSIAANGCSGSRSTMSPHIAAAPSNPLPTAAAASRARPGARAGRGANVTADVIVAGAGTSGGGLTSRDEGVAAVNSRNGRISASIVEAGAAGVGVMCGV